MLLRWILAALHLLALGVGLGAVWGRARALRNHVDGAALRRAFVADGWWAVAAIVWVSTGLWRWLAGTEKPTAYYLQNHAFLGKMALFVAILALEIWPMMTLIRWRVAQRRGGVVNPRHAHAIARISVLQAWLVVGMVLAATAMARGLGSAGD